ncbi:MAG TPA: sigma factor-like helix-turn-helix DNA-binding protein [Gemmataceae bacterium]|nr:sigma factor-like helix-turn-helix DNA-binding protein [Gemmataceae bacterium]
MAESLAKLPADQRQAVERHHLQGCPQAEVARHMNRSKGAVAALLFRGLTKLRQVLADSEADLHDDPARSHKGEVQSVAISPDSK